MKLAKIERAVATLAESPVISVFADGGMVGPRNPSREGISFAWCHVVKPGVARASVGPEHPASPGLRSRTGSGVAAPADFGLQVLSNNHAEFLAFGLALAGLPAGWSGPVHSDSKITLGRFFWGWETNGIPPGWLKGRDAILARLGDLEPILLDGHPTKAQLAAGRGKRGNPVSPHNVWADKECGAVAKAFLTGQLPARLQGMAVLCNPELAP